MSTYNKAQSLRRVLKSIFRQTPPFDWELILVDDGSTDNTREICSEFKKYSNFIYCYRPKIGYTSPGPGRNIGYSLASGEILLCQSSDVVHLNNTLEVFSDLCKPDNFVIGTVYNTNEDGFIVGPWPNGELTGANNHRPFFFLGAITRENMIKIGGDDTDFDKPSWEDDWLGECMLRGLGLQFIITEKAIGMHIDHPRPGNLWDSHTEMQQVFKKKVEEAKTNKDVYFKNCLITREEAGRFIVKL